MKRARVRAVGSFSDQKIEKHPPAICPSGAETKKAIFQKWLSFITFRREMGEDRAGKWFPDTQLLSGQTIAAFGQPDNRLAVQFT